MNTPILNRNQIAPPDDGWYQIEVAGEHPAGAERVQVIDSQAIANIVNNFREDAGKPGFAGMLVDLDHLSHDQEHTTEAWGWLHNVEARQGQLWGRIEWTDLGLAAVQGKRVKFFSTEYDAGDLVNVAPGKVRPMRLAGLALTNRPNNKGGRPISNREEHRQDAGGTLQEEHRQDAGGTLQEEFAADAGGETDKNNKNMKTIAEKLGLPAEATEEQILAAIAAMQSELEGLNNKAKDAEADAICNRHAKRIPEGKRDDWKKAILANREQAEALLTGLPERAEPAKAAQAPERIFNRAAAGTPATVGAAGVDAKVQADAVAAIRNRDQCNNETAWNRARRERPELFV